MEPTPYSRLKESLFIAESNATYQIDRQIASALMLRVNLIALGFFGKPATEVFPGITFTATGQINIDQIWTDVSYQNAFEEGMRRRIQNEPGKYDWYLQRKEQLEALFKAQIKFQHLSEQTSIELLSVQIKGKSTPSASDILYSLIMDKVVAYLQTRNPTECIKITELINSASTDILGDVLYLAFQNLRYANRVFDPVIILFMLHIICDRALDIPAIMASDNHQLIFMIENFLHSCPFQLNARPGFIVELLFHRRSRKQYPPLLIPFIKQTTASQLLMDYVLNEFKTLSSSQWPNKRKSLIQFLQLIEKSKGREVVLTLMKEDSDEEFKRIYELLNSIYITNELHKTYPLLYELFELLPEITSEDIKGIYRVSFKPYKHQEDDLNAFALFFESRYPILYRNNSLIGCYAEGDSTIITSLDLMTKKLKWGLKISSPIIHMSTTSRGLTIATTPNSLYFYDLDNEFKKTAIFFPTDLDTCKLVTLHITPNLFCFLITAEKEGLSVQGGSVNNTKWRKNFKVSIPNGTYIPLGKYFGIKQNGIVTIVNQFGETTNMNCSDIIATSDLSLYTIQQNRLANVHVEDEFLELPRDDLYFLAVGDDGNLILSSKTEKNRVFFVDPKASTVSTKDLGIPVNTLKCSIQKIYRFEEAVLPSSRCKIVHIDNNERIYYTIC